MAQQSTREVYCEINGHEVVADGEEVYCAMCGAEVEED